MNKRKREDNKLYKATHSQALYRDNYRCVLCGSTYGIQVHHIVGRGVGGTSELNNLAVLCIECHVPLAHGVKAKEIRAHLLELVRAE